MTTEPSRSGMHENFLVSLTRSSRLGPRAVAVHLPPWHLIDAGAGIDLFNSAVPVERIGDPGRALDQAERWFAARGEAFHLLLRDDLDAPTVVAAGTRGFTPSFIEPAMSIARADWSPRPLPAELEVCEVADEDALDEYAAVGSDGVAPDVIQAIARRAYGQPGFRLLLGLCRGRPAATAMTLLTPPVAGIYNINVLARLRRRGYGEAMTAAAIEIGWSAGCSGAWLGSTPQSHRIYERLGFRTRYRYVALWRSA